MESGCYVLPNIHCSTLSALTPHSPQPPRVGHAAGGKNTAASAQGLASKFPQKGGTAHLVSSVHWNLMVLCPFPALSHPVTWTPVRTALSGTHRTPVKTPSNLV